MLAVSYYMGSFPSIEAENGAAWVQRREVGGVHFTLTYKIVIKTTEVQYQITVLDGD